MGKFLQMRCDQPLHVQSRARRTMGLDALFDFLGYPSTKQA